LSGHTDIDGDVALNALNAAQPDPAWEYSLVSAEVFFHRRLRSALATRQRPETAKDLENTFVADYVRTEAGT